MSDSAIRVEGLGKEYRIGVRERYRTLRDSLADIVRLPGRGLQRLRRELKADGESAASDRFWALQDVSFDVRQGEVLGVIGSNGAGKSTLLKIISRITEPTTGRITLRGRVGSLLEVGTGFHPELTGRENIFLNGAVLGMQRSDILKKFDAIVAFGEVDQFIDTPVKRYSSGMYMRLAFAVAAHLEPEILVVDEVLAVGDAHFQRKCLGKMKDVAQQGRTVLFVSHNLPMVESLCQRCVVLDRGRVDMVGTPVVAIGRYLSRSAPASGETVDLVAHANRAPGSRPVMQSLRVGPGDAAGAAVPMGGTLAVEVSFDNGTVPIEPVLGVVVKSSKGGALFGANNLLVADQTGDKLTSGVVRVTYRNLPLMPDIYYVDLYLGDAHSTFDTILEAGAFEVSPSDVFGTGRLSTAGAGPFWLPVSFEVSTDRPLREVTFG